MRKGDGVMLKKEKYIIIKKTDNPFIEPELSYASVELSEEEVKEYKNKLDIAAYNCASYTLVKEDEDIIREVNIPDKFVILALLDTENIEDIKKYKESSLSIHKNYPPHFGWNIVPYEGDNYKKLSILDRLSNTKRDEILKIVDDDNLFSIAFKENLNEIVLVLFNIPLTSKENKEQMHDRVNKLIIDEIYALCKDKDLFNYLIDHHYICKER